MPVYAYKGFDQNGKVVSGTRDADSPRTIKQMLRRDGIFLTELNEAGNKKSKQSKSGIQINLRSERVSAQDLAAATRQLATLVGSGIPLVEALAALVDQIENESFKAMWSTVRQRVNEGSGFGDALSDHPRAFSKLYVNMVRAGESSGALDVVLNRLADFTESQAELRSKIIGTMVYPIIMLVMAAGVVGLLMMFVIPKITRIFESQDVALPLPTRVLMGLSGITRDYWFIIFPLLVLAAYGFRRYINSEKGRPKWDRFVLQMPLFGPLVRMLAMARFSKTLGTLLSSGVPLLNAFDIVRAVVQNHVLMDVIERARDQVKEGESIAAPLKRSGEFPPIVTHMISIGERSGQLEQMLNNIARSYEVQVNSRLQALTSIIEPILIVFMGGVVAFIVFSVLMPMLQLSSFAS